MLKASLASASATSCWSSLTSSINNFAKESGLVQRVSKHFSPEQFLITLLYAVSSGKASFSQLVVNLGAEKKTLQISPQALQQRVTRTECGLERFLIFCLVHISQWKFMQADSDRKCTFKRIIIEDSTTIPLPKGNADHFPGCGNAQGKTAGFKVNLAFDLIHGEILRNELYFATEQDKTIGKDLLEFLSEGDLVMRDMGYFGVSSFLVIETLNAFWLSRLPLTADVFTADGGTLEDLLELCTANQIDIGTVELTAQRHSTRLVAIRASKEESEKRRRELHAQAQSRGKAASRKSLIRAGWHLMVTNVPQQMQSVQQLANLYQQRWQIEIVFRGWKQASQLGKALRRTSSPQHLKALILTAMIAMSMSVKFTLNLIRQYPTQRYSLEKIFDYLIGQFLKLRKLVDLGNLTPDHRTLKGQKRKRNSLACNILEVLG